MWLAVEERASEGADVWPGNKNGVYPLWGHAAGAAGRSLETANMHMGQTPPTGTEKKKHGDHQRMMTVLNGDSAVF